MIQNGAPSAKRKSWPWKWPFWIHTKLHVWALIVGALGLTWAFTHSDSDRKEATLRYWAEVTKIVKQADESTETPAVRSASMVEAMAPVREAGAKCSKAKTALISLPVVDVDPKLLDMSVNMVRALQKTESVILRLDTLAHEVDAEVHTRNSFGSFVKEFFRGFTLDYKSSIDENDKLQADLKAKVVSILEELTQAKKECDEVDASLMSLRSELSQRYRVDFPL